MFFKLKLILSLIDLKRMKKRYSANLNYLQKKRWKRFQSILNQSPFYKNYSIKKLQLEDYPLMNKNSFMTNFNEINTHGIDKEHALEIAFKAEESRDFSPMISNVTIGLSSGTSGNRGVFLATEKERAQWVACVLDRVIGFSLKKRTVAFFLRANSNLYDSVKSKLLKFEFFDLLETLENHVARLNKIQPTILVAQPSMLLELANEIEKGTLKLHPTKIISVAEVLYPEDKKRLEKTFKQIIHQVYQCTEGFLASTCSEGYLHFNEDFLIIEKKYIDETKTRFHPVVTDLIRSSQPIVRYELNDIIHELKSCKCGAKTTAIAQIEGRSDDILVFNNEKGESTKIFPDFFRRAIIMSDDAIIDYSVNQRSPNLIELYINGEENSYDKALNSTLKLLEKYKVQKVEIKRILTNNHQKGNKLRRIKNESN